jgi:galactose mutarotase-like enzyme
LAVITLQNDRLTVQINEQLGAEIAQISVNGSELLAYYDWDSPVAVGRSTSYGKHRHDWLSEYRGGWQFLIPNAGPECEVDGVNLPFHGEWSRTHVDVVAHTESMVRVRAGTRLPITVTREISLRTNPDRVEITTTVHNPSTESTSFIWGEHPAFRASDGDLVDLPTTNVADASGSPLGIWPLAESDRLDVIDDKAPHESVHFITDLDCGWAALRRSDVGVAMAWEARDFPHVWLWRENGSKGFPFYGRASLVAIEPACTWPGLGLAEARRRGQAIDLAPGQSRSTTMSLTPFVPTNARVSKVTVDGHITFGS